VSGSYYFNQISCQPSVLNAGNYYSWRAADVNGTHTNNIKQNSIYPKNWKMPTSIITDMQGLSRLTKDIYVISKLSTDLYRTPISFTKTGTYVSENFTDRGNSSYYRLSNSTNRIILQWRYYVFYGSLSNGV